MKPLVFGHFMGNDLYGYIHFYTFLHIFIHLKKLKIFPENFLIYVPNLMKCRKMYKNIQNCLKVYKSVYKCKNM